MCRMINEITEVFVSIVVQSYIVDEIFIIDDLMVNHTGDLYYVGMIARN